MIDLYLLRSFVTVVQLKSFSAAAHKLFLSQPTISKHISTLEKNMGTQLISRTTHGISLTPAGEALAAGAAELLEMAETLENNTVLAGDSANGKISVAMETFHSQPIADFFASFVSSAPNIDLTLTNHSYLDDVLNALSSKSIDMGFIRSFEMQPGMFNSGIKVMFLQKERMGLMVSGQHPLAGRSSVKLSELNGEVFYFLRHHRTYHCSFFYDAVKKANSFVSPDLPTHVEDLLFLVRQNKGISFIGPEENFCNGKDLCYIDIEDMDMSYYIAALWNSDISNPHLPVLIKAMKSYFTVS